MKILYLTILSLLLAIVGSSLWLGGHFRTYRQRLKVQPALVIPNGAHHSYSTNFAVTEIAISGGGKWIDGKTAGLDWTNSVNVPGLAFGTESGFGSGKQQYDDATALLSGAWEPNQTVEATVHSQNQDDIVFEEVELRLRSSLSPHRATGYEVLFRCLKTRKAYASVVRWDGPLGAFTYLAQGEGASYGVSDGDLVEATIIGNVITARINGALVLQATDPVYESGNPGMGFWFRRGSGVRNWLHNSAGGNLDYGFTRFAAWD